MFVDIWRLMDGGLAFSGAAFSVALRRAGMCQRRTPSA